MPDPTPPVALDPFSNEAWALGQHRLDYEKCRHVEERGDIPTVWPKGFETP
jgi:hypothetical protein